MRRPLPVANEFSRPFDARQMRKPSVEITLEPTALECAALANRFNLEALDSFKATVKVTASTGGKLVNVSGRYEAEIVQNCVVSLEPVPSQIYGLIDRDFAEETQLEISKSSVDFDPGVPDPPDAITGGIVDLGEMVAEQFGLEIEPFPRVSGIEFSNYIEDKDYDEETVNPFAALKELKK